MPLDINFRIIALDPGGTTGWATYSAVKIPGLDMLRYESWHCGHLGPSKHHAALNQLLGMQHVQDYTIVCERFTDRVTEHAVDLAAREYIGIVEAFCQEREVPLVMQMSSTAKVFTKDTNLKKLGLWSPGWKHAMDARRHLLWYIINGTPERHSALNKVKSQLLNKGWK
jgi:hypothetical protein